jgi:hypothetical protein
MRINVPLFAASLLLISSPLAGIPQAPTTTPSAPQRDPQAVALLQQSVSAMGVPPSDSSATGSVTIVAGSSTKEGTIQILTRGASQTSVSVQAGSTNWTVIYSGVQANRNEDNKNAVLPLEEAASNQSLHFPLPFLYGVVNNPDSLIQFVGQETLGNSSVNHIRVQNTFASSTSLKFLSEFTAADIWLDATTALPVKVGMTRRFGGGSAPRIPISFAYSNYQTVSGVRYPFTIQEYLTETLWATTTIQTVNFNTGLTDGTFPLATEAN